MCIATFLDSQSLNGLVGRLSCSECSEPLTFEAIQRFARQETFERYKRHLVDQLVSKHHSLIWCPLGCGTSIVQSTGVRIGITLCLTCNRQFCSQYSVEWHTEHACEEYDKSLADPTFRSREQIKAVTKEEYALQDARLQQDIIDASNIISQHSMEAKQATEARRLATIEREARERRLAGEIAAREEKRRRKEEEAKRIIERKKEEEMTGKLIHRVTKPCPRCRVPIEKNGGCDHMICERCDHHFNWLGASW